jgi:3-oxoacyl-[acyl-carrier protein] reductase
MNASNSQLQGRTALVTGAGGGGIGGIGRGIALALAAEGANVVIAVRRRASGEETAALIAREQGTALVVQCDVSIRANVDAAVSAAASAFGGLDIVVHSACNRDGENSLALEEVTEGDWDAQASVAWDAAYFLAQAALPYLKLSARASFIMLGSLNGLHGSAMNPVYSALKGSIRGFIKALAREWGRYQITVNAIEPIAVARPTEVLSKLTPQAVAQITRSFPMGRFGRPREDIGRAVVALCSDNCGFVTAQSIQVDGGVYTAV